MRQKESTARMRRRYSALSLLLAWRPLYLLGYSADYSSSVAIKALHGPVVSWFLRYLLYWRGGSVRFNPSFISAEESYFTPRPREPT